VALDALDVAVLVARALGSVGVDYFLGGSVASSLQGEPRSTNDIDFVVDLAPAQVQPLVASLGADFEVDQESLQVKSPEDTILRKLLWFVQVLRMSGGRLDGDSLRRWSAAVGLSPLLERARQGASRIG
jgi:hypothetical protein